MSQTKYYIKNLKHEYFVELDTLNQAVFTKDKTKATQIEYSDVMDLISLIGYNQMIIEKNT